MYYDDFDDLDVLCDRDLAEVLIDAAGMVTDGYTTGEIIGVLRTLPDSLREEIGIG